ncbi:MAG: MlaD family protein [Oleidesulfovibrio sp.]
MLNKQDNKKEVIKAALTLLLGLVVLGLFIVAFGGHRFWETLDTYSIRFLTVKDLSVGRPVKYAGINIGRVLEIDVDSQDPAQIRVVIGVKEGFTVYEGTVASITQKGLVGDNYVLLSLAAAPGNVLPVQSEIPPDTSTSIFEAAASVGQLVRELQPRLISIADNLDTLLVTVNKQNMGEVAQNLNTVLQTADNSIKTLTSEISAVSKETAAGIREARAVMRKLDGGVDNANAAMHSTNQAMLAIKTQTEAVGTMMTRLGSQLGTDLEYDQVQVEEILRNTRELTHNLNMLSRSLRDRPWQVIFHPSDEQQIR